MNIYLVRHGQTEFNQAGLLQGWADSPLTPNGIVGVIKTGQAFARTGIRFQHAFCSTSPRTQHTADLILHHAGQEEMRAHALADLREYHFGSFEGQNAMILHEKIVHECGYESVEAWLHAYRHGENHLLAHIVSRIDPQQRAENEHTFLTRLQKGLHHIIGQCAPDDNVLVVSHGMAIVALVKAIAPRATRYKSPPNASATLLHFDVFGGLTLRSEMGGALPQ